MGKASTPGIPMNMFGPSSAVMSIWLRVRSSRGFGITNDSALLTGLGRSSPGATTTKTVFTSGTLR